MRQLGRLTAFVPLTLAISACFGEPNDYDEYILKYVTAGMDRSAVHALQESCEKKFPSSTPTSNQDMP
jgi:hypothetical protein